MNKIRFAILISVLACFSIVIATAAQAEQLTLKLSRDWGYGGFNNDIQGLFTMHITGPADLAKVTYYIDSTVIGQVDTPSSTRQFNLQFSTDNYPLGIHDLSAVGTSSAGQEYRSNTIQAEFVPASQSGKIVIPILAVVFGAILISALVPLLMSRKAKKLPAGGERNYGVGGGAICPKCHRPFPLPLLSMHLGFSKVAICPYCGKLSLVRPEPLEKLRQAEKAELAGAEVQIPEEAEEDKLKKDLDNSKYQGF